MQTTISVACFEIHLTSSHIKSSQSFSKSCNHLFDQKFQNSLQNPSIFSFFPSVLIKLKTHGQAQSITQEKPIMSMLDFAVGKEKMTRMKAISYVYPNIIKKKKFANGLELEQCLCLSKTARKTMVVSFSRWAPSIHNEKSLPFIVGLAKRRMLFNFPNPFLFSKEIHESQQE